MAMMKAVAFFEGGVGRVAGVEKTVGGIKYPHREEYGSDRAEGQENTAAARDEPCPQCGDRGRVERNEVP